MTNVDSPDADTVDGMDASDFATNTDLTSHENDTSNPHGVTDDQTGAAAALSSHENDTSNPHGVTASQVGALVAGQYDHESGTVSYTSNGSGTNTVSFNNAYQTAAVEFKGEFGSNQSSNYVNAWFNSWQTDASGNITGVTYNYQTDSTGYGATLHYSVFGVK